MTHTATKIAHLAVANVRQKNQGGLAMSRVENPTLRELEYAASATGEIHSMTTDSIEIRGIFTPGQSLVLRPGAKVFILTADDALSVLDSHAGAAIDNLIAEQRAEARKTAGGK